MDDVFEIFEDIFSDDDEAIMEFVERPRRRKIFRNRINHFQIWDDQEFLVRFRISREGVTEVLHKIEESISHVTNRLVNVFYKLCKLLYMLFCRNQAVDPLTQLLLTLRFYASGSMIITTGDFVGIHKSTASRSIARVTRAIAALAQEYIQMPSEEDDISKVKTKFYELARFPKVIGAIDCTHVRIQSPGRGYLQTHSNLKYT